MQLPKSKNLQAVLAATVAASIVMPIAIAGAAGSSAPKANTAKQVKALRQQSLRLTRFALAVNDQVAILEERTAALEGQEPPSAAFPVGPAGGDLIGSYPNPVLGPNSVGSAEIFDGAVGTDDIGDSAVGAADIADNAVGTLEIQDGSVSGPDLKGSRFFQGPGVVVRPGDTQVTQASCPAGWRLIGGGFEWENNSRNNMSVISSGPSGDNPESTWGVQGRVDTDGAENAIFASALCLEP